MIKDGSSGVLTSLDVTEIVNAVQSLLSDPSLRNRLGESAKIEMSARYGVARLVSDYQKLYLL